MMSICRAHCNEALLLYSNSLRCILINWVKKALWIPIWALEIKLERAKTCTQNKRQCKNNRKPYSQTSTWASSYRCKNSGAAILWGMLNIYLSCLPRWLHQSAHSHGVSINLTLKDSSPPWMKSKTMCEHLCRNNFTSLLCYFSVCCVQVLVSPCKHLGGKQTLEHVM